MYDLSRKCARTPSYYDPNRGIRSASYTERGKVTDVLVVWHAQQNTYINKYFTVEI